MNYIEFTVSTSTAAADAVSAALIDSGAVGTQILDRADLPDPDHPLHDWELMDQSVIDAMPEDVQVKAWLEENLAARVHEELPLRLEKIRSQFASPGTLSVTTQQVPGQDWSETWKKYYKPFRAGKHLVIRPSWEPWQAREGDLVIQIDPGMAFGTGTHETTALCVELIEKYYREGSFLDLGCGSGILSLCAAALGARDVTGVDIDPDAVLCAEENVRKNGMEDRIIIREGDLMKGLDRRFDAVAANILAPILCILCPALPAAMNPGGLFICSGILTEQAQSVLDAMTAAGLRVLERRDRGDWTAFAAVLDRNEAKP